MTANQKLILQNLYPQLNDNLIKFVEVHEQPNYIDCGVFAIAIDVSVICGMNPKNVKYEHSFMRKHLLYILENHHIMQFPVIDKSKSRKINKQRN